MENKTKRAKNEEEYEIFIPKERNERGNVCEFVAVNGRTFMVPKGKRVTVPKCVAKVLENSENMRIEQGAYEQENINS